MNEELDRLEYYKELYYRELESKELLANRFATNISIVTLLFAGLVFCVKNVNDLKEDWYFYIFLAFTAISIIANIVIIVLLSKYLAGSEYEFVPSARELETHYEKLKLFYLGRPSSTENAESEFRKDLITYYLDAADFNFRVNDVRIKKMVRVHKCIIISVTTTILAASCYIPTFFKEDANVQKVEIFKPSVDKKEKQESKNKKSDTQGEDSKKKAEINTKKSVPSKEEHNGKEHSEK
ncbi:hypothetical protein ACWZQY_026980 [Priestia megaterium]